MGKSLKIVISVITVLLFLLSLTVLTVSYLIDPNDYKAEIVSAVKEQTGRVLKMDGELKLSFFPWLGLSTGKVELSNAPGFVDKPFAALDDVEIAVKLLPLLSKKIEIGRLGLKKLQLNLARKKQGLNNWDDLTAKSEQNVPSTSGPASSEPAAIESFSVLALSGIDIEDATINWDDRQSDQVIAINQFNFKTGAFAFNEPMAVDLSFVLSNAKTRLTESIDMTGELLVNDKLDNIQFRQSRIDSVTEGEEVPGRSLKATLIADVALDWSKQTLKVSGLKLSSGAVNINAELEGTGIKDHPVINGPVKLEPVNPTEALKAWSIAPPAMTDSKALTKLAMNFDVQATENSLSLKNLVMNLDDSQLQGSMQLQNFAEPMINFQMNIDQLNADRYLPPPTKQKKPVSSPATAIAAGSSSVPVEALRKLNMNGDITLQTLQVSHLKMQGIQLKVNAKNGIVTTQQSVKQLYQGDYSGQLKIDARQQDPVLTIDEKLNRVHIEPLLKDYQQEAKISGVLNASAQLRGQGADMARIKSSLNGQLSVHLRDSVIRGFNLQKIIDEGKTLINGKSFSAQHKNDQTLFSSIDGTATVRQGVVHNDDLLGKSSKVQINGKGTADLNSEKLDYQIIAKLIKVKASATEAEQFHDTPVAINVGGTFSQPSYRLDVAAILTEKNKAKINKLMDKLDKKVGPGASDLLKRLF